MQQVPLAAIAANPYQPRQAVSEEAMEELTASVREHGVMQPLVVRSADGGYQVVAGFRRLEAARRAGLAEVPVVVRECADREMLELALVENLQREDINAMEEAQAYRRLGEEFGLSQGDIAHRVGRSRSAVANSLRLLSLPEAIQKTIVSGELSAGHGRALLAVDNTEQMMAVWEAILRGSLSVRQAEALATAHAMGVDVSRETPPARAARRDQADYGTDDANLIALIGHLRDHLQTRVRLRRKGEGGQLVIDYYSDEDLDRIFGAIAGEEACEPYPDDVE